MSKIIVTGGAGFIGSHIVDKLIDKGHEVIVIDNLSASVNERYYFNDRASYYEYDIADYEKVRNLFDGVDFVFHCAAESRVTPSVENPLITVKTNTLGTGTVLQCSREAGVKKVIYSSTSSGYGLKNEPPLVETMPDDCLNPYSVSKIAGEKLCFMYNQLFNLKTVVFRYFNVYGPREPIKGPYAPVIGLFLRQYRAGVPLTIVPNGHQRRDFVHVYDVVKANILAMESDVSNELINIGNGFNYSVLEIANMISDNQVMVEPRLGEARVTLADNSKAVQLLNWTPDYTVEQYIKQNL